MTGYLQLSPTVAYTVLSEILANSGVVVDEPDSARIADILTPKSPTKAAEPMVSIPVAGAPSDVKGEEYREDDEGRVMVRYPGSVSHEDVPNALSFNELQPHGTMTMCQFNEIELSLLQRAISGGQEEDDRDRDLSVLTQSLSLSMMEAQFLRMHLKEFNLKARSVLELFKYCEGPNARFCRCPEIRKRVYEMGILVQRSVP